MAEKKKPSTKQKTSINPHIILLSLIALIFVVIAVKLFFWDKRERKNTDLENDTTLSFETEALDSIVPLESTASGSGKKEIDTDLRILFLGNGSLSDDKTSDTNLANIIRKKSNATVYNCAISDTFMSLKNKTYADSYPYDAFSFYSLCTLLVDGNTETISRAEQDLGTLPANVKESVDLLQSIDYNELDVLCIYYDGSDYLMQRGAVNAEDPFAKTTFCGALNSGLSLIREKYPDIRIIVMSPSFVYVVDLSGNYTSSFMTNILPESISAYVGYQAQICADNNVSFVDNLYGSIYEEIADKYLKNYILLNEKGHTLLADRFLGALNRFHEYDF